MEGVFKRVKNICINGFKVVNQKQLVDIAGRQNLTQYEEELLTTLKMNMEHNILEGNEFLVTRDKQVFSHLLELLGINVTCRFEVDDHLCTF